MGSDSETLTPCLFAHTSPITLLAIHKSSISFTNNKDLSPVGFALKTFATPENPTTANRALFQTHLDLYTAINAGIRSLGDKAPKGALQRVKGYVSLSCH